MVLKSTKKALPSYSKRSVIEELVQDETFQAQIEQYAGTINAPQKSLAQKCESIFKEMVCAYSVKLLEGTRRVFDFLYKPLFSRISVRGNTDTLKEPDTYFLYLPSHRSHMDYLFLSYILDKQGVAPPHIAAGINLAFFPVGGLFRRLGAFFIRRKISGNFLYLLCLKTYIKWLVTFPLSIELFIEGGRSRDGKLKPPQTGLLQLIIEAIEKHSSVAYKIIPISISYDFTPDVYAYLKEEHGGTKRKESMFALARTFTDIERYHGVHFRFLHPIDVKQWIAENGSDKESIKKLAEHAMRSIQDKTIVTAYQILACALLQSDKPIYEDDLYQSCLHIRNYLLFHNVKLSKEAHEFETQYPQLLERITRKKWITLGSGYRYTVVKKNRTMMNYYKYSIMHYLVPVLILRISADNQKWMREILEHEFPIQSHRWFKEPTEATLDPVIFDIAKSIFLPYTHVIDAMHKESLEKIIHSLSIDPEQALSDEDPVPEGLTYQKIKQAYGYLKKKNKEELRQLETFLQSLQFD